MGTGLFSFGDEAAVFVGLGYFLAVGQVADGGAVEFVVGVFGFD